jgi:DNA gyrase subunit A
MATVFDNNIQNEEFSLILQRSYATYGLSVVTDRALPDARDGMKPVQRRILYGMLTKRYLSSRPTVKSAEIVGSILGDYHPHGDSSVYDAIVRMAQDFTMRYPLIEGQGNFGSLDNDPPAAYRYTEARLSPLAEALMSDIERETVSVRPTYKQDPRVVEADYLPGRIPPVVNPSSGIAVGLSTNIPPHNLNEITRAAIALLDKPNMTLDQLMTYVKGPDFPMGGRIMGLDGIKDYLSTGKGRMIIRADVRLEENPRTRQKSLIVVGLPPIGRDKLKASIVKAINDRKLEGLVPDVRDESDTDRGTRVVLELKKDAPSPNVVLQQLFAETDMQIAITAQMVFLFGEPMETARQPKQVGMIELLNYWNNHQLDVLRRRTQYDLTRAQERLHIVEGLIIGSANAQQIVKIFQEAADRDEAKTKIRTKYKLSEKQVGVIADMTLSQVTRLDAGRYSKEKEELVGRIAELESLLANPPKLVALLKKEMQDLMKRFGDDRRTVIDAEGNATAAVTTIASLVDRKELLVALTREGSVKVMPADTFTKGKKERNGLQFALGRGDDGLLVTPVVSSNQDHLLFISNQGRAFGLSVKELPEGNRAAKGESLRERLRLAKGEQIVSLLSVPDFDENAVVVEFTRQGKLKKAPVSEYRTAGAESIPDFKLADGDEVIGALYIPAADADGEVISGDYVITTDKGQTLRFADEEVRAQQGRQGQGIQAINLGGANLIAASFVPNLGADSKYLLLVTADGYGKKISLSEYAAKARATVGVPGFDPKQTFNVVAACIVGETSDVIIGTAKSGAVGLNLAEIKATARGNGRGMQILPLEKAGDSITGALVL